MNDGVDKNIYLETAYTLHYPSMDNITTVLVKLGPAAQLYKIDISCTFLQIKIDHSDIDLLGMYFQNQYYLNLLIAFGYRHCSKIFRDVQMQLSIS